MPQSEHKIVLSKETTAIRGIDSILGLEGRRISGTTMAKEKTLKGRESPDMNGLAPKSPQRFSRRYIHIYSLNLN